MRLSLVVLFALASPLLSQSFASNFVIDKSKPFVYLVFDHIGTQKPHYKGDDPKRLFLRVVNNCNIPIRVVVDDANPGLGYLVNHEVLAWPDSSEILMLGNKDEEVRSYQTDRESALRHMPKGLSMELASLLPVMPGQSLLLNIPRSDVGQYWFIRIEFEFFVQPLPSGTGPSMYLTFTDAEIPFNKR